MFLHYFIPSQAARSLSSVLLASGGVAVGPTTHPCASTVFSTLRADVTALNASWSTLITGVSALDNLTEAVAPVAVVFTSAPFNGACSGGTVRYTLRTNGSTAPAEPPNAVRVVRMGDPFLIDSSAPDAATEFAFRAWTSSGLLQLQAWVDSAVLRATGTPAASSPAGLPASRSPLQPTYLELSHLNNTFVFFLPPSSAITLPIGPLFAVTIFASLLLSRLAVSKRNGERESLMLKGMRPTPFWASFFLVNAILGLFAALMSAAAVFAINSVQRSDFGLVFLFYWLACCSFMSVVAVLDSVVSSAAMGSAALMIVMLAMLGVWSVASIAFTDAWFKLVLAFLAPHIGFLAGFAQILAYDQETSGLTLDGFGVARNPDRDVSVAMASLGLFVSSVLWGVLGVVIAELRADAFVDPGEVPERSDRASAASAAPRRPIEDFDPKASLGKDLSECVVVKGLVRVFHGVKRKPDAVEVLNDDIEGGQLGLVMHSLDSSPQRMCCVPRRAFHGGKDLLAVAGVDFVMAPGQVTCLLGHNGSGKTTTINLITGALAMTAGSISYFGERLTSETSRRLRKLIAHCPQHNVNFPGLTAREHLELFMTLRAEAALDPAELRRKIDEALGKVLLLEHADRLVDMFSGGMRRKLALGAALLNDCPILLLDEPTSGCDPATRRVIWDLILDERRKGRCIILTTHELTEAEVLSDRVIMLKRGRIVAAGSKMFLKEQFTDGYRVSASLPDEAAAAAAAHAVEGIRIPVPGATDASAGAAGGSDASKAAAITGTVSKAGEGSEGRVLQVSVSWGAAESLPDVLDAIAAQSPTGVEIRQASVESVFLAIADELEQPLDGRTREAVAAEAQEREDAKESDCCGEARKPSKRHAAAATTAGEGGDAAAVVVPVRPAVELGPMATGTPALASASGRAAASGSDGHGKGDQGKPTAADRAAAEAADGMAATLSGIRPTGGAGHFMDRARVLCWARTRSSETRSQLVVPVIYMFMTIAILFAITAATSIRTEQKAANPITSAPLNGFDLAWVVSPIFPLADQMLFAEQFACAALGYHNATPVPAVAAATSPPIALPTTAGCNGVATVAEDGGRTLLIAHTTRLYMFDNISHLQDAAAVAAEYFGGRPSKDGAGNTIIPSTNQLAGGIGFSPFPVNATSFGGRVDGCPGWPNNPVCSGTANPVSAAPQMGAFGIYNSSLPASGVVLSQALARAALLLGAVSPSLPDAASTALETTIAPWPVEVTVEPDLLLVSILLPIFLGIGVANMLTVGPTEAARDLENGMRSKLQIMGLNAYYATLVAMDLVTVLVPIALFFVIAVATETPIVGDSRWFGMLVITLLAIPPTLFFFYLVSGLMAASEDVTSLVLPNLSTLIGMVPHFVIVGMTFTGKQEDIDMARQTRDILAFVPVFQFYAAISRIIDLGDIDGKGDGGAWTAEQVFSWEDGVLWYIMWFFIDAVVLGAALYLVDNWAAAKTLFCRGTSGALSGGVASDTASSDPAKTTGLAVMDESVTSETERARRLRDGGGSLVAEGLTFEVPDSSGVPRRILDDWTMGLAKGEVVALLGPAGAGKTTAIRALVGDSATQRRMRGSVLVDGQARDLMRGQIGYCPQEDALWPKQSVEVHLHVFAAVRGIPSDERAGLIRTLTQATGLHQHLGKTVSQLSGGNKRKLGLATAALGVPRAGVYDEPSTGVDPGARRSLWSIIRGAQPNCAQLVSTHSMDEASSLGTRVAIMAGGRLRTIGTPDELRDRFCRALYVDIEATSAEARKRIEADLLTSSGGPPRLGEGSVVIDRVGVVLKVSVTRGDDGDAVSKARRIAGLFRTLQSLSKDDIRFYSVAEPTLEDVFLVVVKTSQALDGDDDLSGEAEAAAKTH